MHCTHFIPALSWPRDPSSLVGALPWRQCILLKRGSPQCGESGTSVCRHDEGAWLVTKSTVIFENRALGAPVVGGARDPPGMVRKMNQSRRLELEKMCLRRLQMTLPARHSMSLAQRVTAAQQIRWAVCSGGPNRKPRWGPGAAPRPPASRSHPWRPAAASVSQRAAFWHPDQGPASWDQQGPERRGPPDPAHEPPRAGVWVGNL